MEKLKRLLGIANKAGALSIGRTATEEGIFKNRVSLVLFACDASETMKKKIVARSKSVKHQSIELSTDELGKVLGRNKVAILAVCNPHLAAGIQNQLDSPC